MIGLNRTVLGALLLTLLAAAGGGWIGVHYGLRESRAPDLDEFLHHTLDLSGSQEHRIAALEAEFAGRRKILDDEMRAANRALAAAIADEHVYGPAAKAAVDRFHIAAAKLQDETIRHVLAMRGVLTPSQAESFDAVVSRALNAGPP